MNHGYLITLATTCHHQPRFQSARLRTYLSVEPVSDLKSAMFQEGAGTPAGGCIVASQAKPQDANLWARRPLSNQLVAYAIESVAHLLKLRKVLLEACDARWGIQVDHRLVHHLTIGQK